MSGNTEPRRWTIGDTYGIPEVYREVYRQSIPPREIGEVEVVEASAFDALAAENAALREALHGLDKWCREIRDGLDRDLNGTTRAALAMVSHQIGVRTRRAVQDAALTQLARDAQDAGAHDPVPAWTCRTCGIEDDQWEHTCPTPIQAASHRHFGYADAARDSLQRGTGAAHAPSEENKNHG